MTLLEGSDTKGVGPTYTKSREVTAGRCVLDLSLNTCAVGLMNFGAQLEGPAGLRTHFKPSAAGDGVEPNIAWARRLGETLDAGDHPGSVSPQIRVAQAVANTGLCRGCQCGTYRGARTKIPLVRLNESADRKAEFPGDAELVRGANASEYLEAQGRWPQVISKSPLSEFVAYVVATQGVESNAGPDV